MRQIKNIKHIGLYVKNFEKMISFYVNVMGFIELARYEEQGEHINKILKTKNGRLKICKLVSPYGKEKGKGDMLELIYFPENSKNVEAGELFATGMAHVGLGVGEIHGLCQSICNNGGRIVVEPMSVKGNYLAFCQDIEGNYLELIENR